VDHSSLFAFHKTFKNAVDKKRSEELERVFLSIEATETLKERIAQFHQNLDESDSGFSSTSSELERLAEENEKLKVDLEAASQSLEVIQRLQAEQDKQGEESGRVEKEEMKIQLETLDERMRQLVDHNDQRTGKGSVQYEQGERIP